MRTFDAYIQQNLARYMGHRAANLRALEAPTLPGWAREAHRRMADTCEARIARLADQIIAARAA